MRMKLQNWFLFSIRVSFIRGYLLEATLFGGYFYQAFIVNRLLYALLEAIRGYSLKRVIQSKATLYLGLRLSSTTKCTKR